LNLTFRKARQNLKN